MKRLLLLLVVPVALSLGCTKHDAKAVRKNTCDLVKPLYADWLTTRELGVSNDGPATATAKAWDDRQDVWQSRLAGNFDLPCAAYDGPIEKTCFDWARRSEPACQKLLDYLDRELHLAPPQEP